MDIKILILLLCKIISALWLEKNEEEEIIKGMHSTSINLLLLVLYVISYSYNWNNTMYIHVLVIYYDTNSDLNDNNGGA